MLDPRAVLVVYKLPTGGLVPARLHASGAWSFPQGMGIRMTDDLSMFQNVTIVGQFDIDGGLL